MLLRALYPNMAALYTKQEKEVPESFYGALPKMGGIHRYAARSPH